MIGFVQLVSHKRVIPALAIVALTPTTLAFAMGVGSYFSGHATLVRSGYPATEFHNVDRISGAERTTSGCCVSGNEWIFQLPYNTAIITMSAMLGPVKGGYDGPYPTEKEAKEAIKNGQSIPLDSLKSDQINVDGKVVRLDSGVGEEMLERMRYEMMEEFRSFDFPAEPSPPITATVYERRCLILRIPIYHDEAPDSAAIALFDINRGRPFAFYSEGVYSHNFPPVRWQRR